MTLIDDSNSSAELGQTVGLLARLVEVSLALNSTLDPNQLLQSIIDAAAELLNCEAASLMLYDDKKGELRFRAATGTDPEKLGEIPVPLEGSLAGTIFRENRHLLINNVQEDPRHYGGLGLGLAIASESVTLHGGRIWAESEGLDQGATFYVALPLAGQAFTSISYAQVSSAH